MVSGDEIGAGKNLCNEPRGNTAPVAWLGPSLPGVISLHLITALLSGDILNRHLPGWTSRQDLGYQHPALATDWALPQRRAGEFFIALTIVLLRRKRN
jgi:hypothetical protein